MPTTTPAAALAAIAHMPTAEFGHYPTPIDELIRFRRALGLAQRIVCKRDDAISFGFGGNKVRKLRYLIPTLLAEGVDTIVTTGGVQSNHARATAAAAAVSGLRCHIVVNGVEPASFTGNARLNQLLGASVEYVAGRQERKPAMEAAAARLTQEGRRPAIVPLGASTPHGALGYIDAVGELVRQNVIPDVIVHACSSGGTSAGILSGIALHGLQSRVIGISADDPPDAVGSEVRSIIAGVDRMLGTGTRLSDAAHPEVDDGFVGPGYGAATSQSTEAQQALARQEAIFVDHTYSAKALAGLIGYCRDGRIPRDALVLFWHTGGQVALFA